jgi:hypothetical protein
MPKMIKFVPWIYSCIEEGSVSKVDPAIHDVFITHKRYQAQVLAKYRNPAVTSTKPQANARARAPSPSPGPSSNPILKSKGKQRAVETPQSALATHPAQSRRPDLSEQSRSMVTKRTIDVVEPSTPFALGNSPTKRRKVQPTEK